LLAVIDCLNAFQIYLIGIHFTIITDNQTIRYIRTTRSENLKRRQLHWIEYLQTFDFDIRHAPGKNNFLADYLSRIYSNPNLQIEPKDFVTPDIDDSDAEPTIFSAAISTLTSPMSPSPTPSTIRNDSASPTPLTYEEFVENITPLELHPELEQHYDKQDAVIAATDSAKHFLNEPRDIDLIEDIILSLNSKPPTLKMKHTRSSSRIQNSPKVLFSIAMVFSITA